MGADSKIEWTHHTFNPWRGCTKVSDGCKNCYADKQAKRNPGVLGVWGPNGSRVVASESYWRQPLQWNAWARSAGERHRVFCASMADVFEANATMPAASVAAVRAARVRLFELIRTTPHLDWLLLTKRPENWRNVIEESLIFAEGGDPDDKNYFADRDGSFPQNDLAWWLNNWTGEEPPENVWLGTSVEDQKTADERIPHLLQCTAAVRFLSCEPLLGAIDIQNVCRTHSAPPEEITEDDYELGSPLGGVAGIDWVIVGGESGPGARPMHPDWARSIRDQCQAAGVPFFFKQWGEFKPISEMPEKEYSPLYVSRKKAPPGQEYRQIDIDECYGRRCTVETGIIGFDGEFAAVGEGRFESIDGHLAFQTFRVGKKAAGRLLDGRTWDEMPAPAGAKVSRGS